MENIPKRQTQNDAVLMKWENMNSEILGFIFTKISESADEIIRSVSLVCRGWLEAVVGPYCWAEINVDRWCREAQHRDLVDSVVRKLVRRSKCTVRSLKAYRVGNVGFAYVATCERFLTVLQIPLSEVTDDMVEKHAGSLVNLKELDISYCLRITHKGLSSFGKSCQTLTNLKRNLIPSLLSYMDDEFSLSEVDDDEAYAIAITMPGLCRLELGYGSFGDHGLNQILTNCKSLTHLDIDGCGNVSLDGDLKERCERLSVFISPVNHIFNTEESTESGSVGSDCDEESSSFSSANNPCSSDSN